MALFYKPKWLRPEINEVKYWIHLAILSAVILGTLYYLAGKGVLTLTNWLWLIPILALGDIIAHTLLRMD